MNLIVKVRGRDAIPVRAIPMLADWHFWRPHVLALALAGGVYGAGYVSGLRAYRVDNGDDGQPIPERWWEGWSARNLKGLEDAQVPEIDQETGYRIAPTEVLALLPAGIFVLKTEFESAHESTWQSRVEHTVRQKLDLTRQEDGQDPESLRQREASHQEAMRELNRWRRLDYRPVIQPAHLALVMEGFSMPQPAAADIEAAAAAKGADNATPIQRSPASRPRFTMARAALIQAHKNDWPTIQRDLKDASKNGLAKAKAGDRDWYEDLALEWARSRGKLNAAPNPLDIAMRALPARPVAQSD
jgi:hypothetical protein